MKFIKISDFFSANKIQKKTKKKFKIITALSDFYDSTDPNKFLKDAKKLLTEDGIFLLEFADLASIIKNKMFDTICHEHLEYYSSEVIINLCKKNGLRVFNIKSNDINGASKQYFVCHENSHYKNNLVCLLVQKLIHLMLMVIALNYLTFEERVKLFSK